MHPAPLTVQGAVNKSVYIHADKVFIINKQIVVAVETIPIFLVESGFDVALAIITVVLVGNLYL